MRFRCICFYITLLLIFSIGAGHTPTGATPRNPIHSDSLSAEPPLSAKNYLKDLKPEKIHRKTSRQIVNLLRKRHYSKLAVDDRLSARLLKRYLSDLDFNRIYFLAEDIRRFEIYRHELDDALKSGDLRPAYRIYNRYKRQVVQRLVFLINYIHTNFDKIDLNVRESLNIDRENTPWPPDEKAIGQLWIKWLKNDVLKLKMAGKSIEKISQTLDRRYRSQLNRIRQTNSEDVFRIYMNALASCFDPHTQYFSPRMQENFKIQMSLSLEGIGAVLQTENEHTKVVRLVPAGPADKGKDLMPGDRIIGVGQGRKGEIIDVVGWRLDDVVQLIRGDKGTVVRLEILPSGIDDYYKTKIISIARNTVRLEEQAAQKRILDLEHQEKAYRIGIIELPTFYLDFKAYHSGRSDYKSTTRDVQRLLKELQTADVDGIIIDLRDNGGGALQEANELTGLFIKKGPTVQIRDTGGKISSLSDEDPYIGYTGPLVVMVNRMSASAAEIFAGAIQDYNRGIIIGSQSFGKGTVQSLLDLNHGQLKITFAKFYRVTGKSTQHDGIIPDISYPSVHDIDKIGESALPDALPWSRIQPVRYQAYPKFESYLERLKLRHHKRSRNAPDFAYLLASTQEIRENQRQTLLPLDEASRKRLVEENEKRRLVIENRRRIAKGQRPIENLPEMNGENGNGEDPSSEDDEAEPDPLLIESGHILADLIMLSQQR